MATRLRRLSRVFVIPGGLRARLMLIVALAGLPVVGQIFFDLLETRVALNDEIGRDAARLAQIVAISYDREIGSARRFLQTVAALDDVRSLDSDRCGPLLAKILETEDSFTNVGLVGRDGALVCSGTPTTAGANLADRHYFQEVLATNDFAVGEYVVGRFTGKPALALGYPVRSQSGAVSGVVFAGFDLDWLRQLALGANLPPGATMVMVDRYGTVVADYPESARNVGNALPDGELRRALAAQLDGVASMPGIDGVPRLFAFPERVANRDSGLSIAVGLPMEQSDQAVFLALERRLALLIVVNALGLAVVWLGADRLVIGPLEALLRTARRMEAGDLRARTEIVRPAGEMGQLAGAFDQMAAALEDREAKLLAVNATLEERVKERTAALEKANTTLGEAQRFLEHINAQSPMVIFQIRHGLGDGPSYVSPNAANVLGYSASELVANPELWFERIHPEDRPKVIERIQAAYALAATGLVSEYRFQHRSGEYRWLQTISFVEYDPSGTVDSGLGYVLDVTDRKLSEEDQVRARAEADRANQAKSEFLSRMSHELRTPLNIVLGFSELLSLDPLDPDQSESVGHIQKAGRHLLDLINDVLDISRIEAGRMPLSIEPVSVGESVKELADLLGPFAESQQVRFDCVDATDSSWRMLADRQRLRQVLLNLGTNAIKFNRPNGRVTIRCSEQREGWLRLAVIDTGLGISPDQISKLFLPFERLDAAERGIEGTGLGLALTRTFVEAMGGTIGVETVAGEGSTFWIELPRATAVPDEIPSSVEAELTSVSAAQRIGDDQSVRTLLCIEDNLGNMALLERLLAPYPSIRLLSAVQGRLGLTLAYDHRPDLILLDLHLPDLRGETVLHRLRAMPETADIPVIVLTADATPGQRDRLLAAGAQDYLTKPVPLRQLLQILQGYLELVPSPL